MPGPWENTWGAHASLNTVSFLLHGGKMRLRLKSKVTSQKCYDSGMKFNLV